MGDLMRVSVAKVCFEEHLNRLDVELAKESGRNPAVMLSESKELSKVWPELAGVSALDSAFDAVSALQTRWKATRATVKTRMQQAMEEALLKDDNKKKQALEAWASEFDAAVKDFSESSLVEELTSKAAS